MRCFGIIGFPLEHSFSKAYFSEKFKQLQLYDCSYVKFPIHTIEEFPRLILQNPNLEGLNVTIPYKTSIIPFLTNLSPEAQKIGAVNCIKINRTDQKIILSGYNTDALGFEQSLKPLLQKQHTTAFVLGNGGAAKAVRFALDKMNIQSKTVTRKLDAINSNTINYDKITEAELSKTFLIVNTTPLGMFPHVEQLPDLPYNSLTSNHLLYDLIYNPQETVFLQKGKKTACLVKNGLEMLKLQADATWEIWNKT